MKQKAYLLQLLINFIKNKGDQCTLPPIITFDENNNIVEKPNTSNDIRTSTFSIYCSDD